MRILLAVTSTTPGTTMERLLTSRLNLPVAEREKLPGRPTAISKVARMPARTAVTPELDCEVEELEPPNAREAESIVMAMVRMTLPSLKPKSAMEMPGFSNLSGPKVKVEVVEAVAEEAASSRIISVDSTLVLLWMPPLARVAKEPATNLTRTSPVPKRVAVLVVLPSIRK